MTCVSSLDFRKAKISLDTRIFKCARYGEFLSMLRSRCFYLLFLVCLPAVALAQQLAPPTGAPTARPAAGEGQVKLDVVVTDKSGEIVSGLQSSDFTLLDNNRPATLLSFQAYGGTALPEAPVQVVLVIDNVNEGFDDVSLSKNDVETFLRQNGGHLAQPLSIFWFTNKGLDVQPTPSQDGNALAAQVEAKAGQFRAITNNSGAWGALERFETSFNTLNQIVTVAAHQPGRKLLIWVGGGWPLLGGPNVAMNSSKDQQRLFANIVEISGKMRQGQTTVYSAKHGMPDGQFLFYKSFVKGANKEGQATISSLNIKVLAEQSGGVVIVPTNDLAAELNKCVQDASAYYRISFDPPSANGPNEYHELKVSVNKPGLTARTNTGYYNQPAAAPAH
jgi:VWFA-related protein